MHKHKMTIDYTPNVVKFYGLSLNAQYVAFQQCLCAQRASADAQRQPGYQAVYFVAVPVGYVSDYDRIGLMFNSLVRPRVARRPTDGDRAQLKDQMKSLHWLGYCHLDLTEQNIGLDGNDRCYLLDCVAVRTIALCLDASNRLESSDPSNSLDPSDVSHDLRLWYQLQSSVLKHLPPEQQQCAVGEEKEQITASTAGNKVAIMIFV